MNVLSTHFPKRIYSVILAIAVIISGLCIPQNTKIIKAASPVVESAISWAVAMANDNSHGYSQKNRWGPDYDCSSFVISAFRNAGVNVGTATYTGNMRAQFTQHGFQWIPWSQIGGTSSLQRGDVLLNEKYHTEIYLGNNQNVGAHSDRGYPQLGDQTGTEVSVSGYYYHPWDGVLRYAGSSVCTCSTDYAGEYYASTSSLPLMMRSGHGTGYSAIVSIPKGSKVYVSRSDGSWAHVEWNGYSGYCSMSYLSKIESKSYNLHVWVSDSKMGDMPADFLKGKRYYICYELIDESTGKKANETSNMNYTVSETIRNSSGKVCEYSYQNSDNNWIWIECGSEDTYTGTVTVSGDVGISCSISFDVYADTAPQFKIWAWDTDDTKETTPVGVGEKANCTCLIRDKYTEKRLNDVTSRWMTGGGYTVTLKVYDPSGSLVGIQSYKNNDYTSYSFVPDKVGSYTIETSVTGNMTGTIKKVVRAEEKEHKFGSWITTRKATCDQTGTEKRTCSICGQIETRTIAKTEHTYDNGKIICEATSTQNGIVRYTCSGCGDIMNEVVPAPGQISTPSPTPVRIQTPTPTPIITPVPVATESPLSEVRPVPTVRPGNTVIQTPVVTAGSQSNTNSEINSNTEPDEEISEDCEIEEDLNSSYEDEDTELFEGMVFKNKKTGVSYKILELEKTVAFYKSNNKNAQKIVVPNTILIDGVTYKVVEISDRAFSGCKKLKHVTIGKNVTEIGNRAFMKCTSLRNITIPSGVTKIGKKAFYNCKNLKRITIKSKKLNSNSVGDHAFGCTSKRKLVLVPKGFKKVYAKWLRKKCK